MFFVYILTDNQRSVYIGYTNDLQRRLDEHQSGKVFTTKKMNNPRLYYFEAYVNEGMAKEREKKLKQFGSSYVGLMKRINLKK